MLVEQYGPLKGQMLQIMDETGSIVQPDLVPDLSDEEWLELYKTMLRTRTADMKALQLQRQGRMLTYAPNTGQEAAQVGSAAAMERMIGTFPPSGNWAPGFIGVYLWRLFTFIGTAMNTAVSSRKASRISPLPFPSAPNWPMALDWRWPPTSRVKET